MTESDGWLQRFEKTQQDLTNRAVYWTALPMAVFGTVGLLWSLPVPDAFFAISPLLNWGTAFLMAAAVYYFIISVSLAIGMLPVVIGIAGFYLWLDRSGWNPLRLSIGLFVAGIIGLWLGRRGKSGIRPFFQDLQLIMIGPAWLLSVLFKRIGIPL
jgi:hypothetical protein